MKSILISIKPKWVAKILNGEKTIEIRKTMPKCDLPIDVYIYCTKDKETIAINPYGGYATIPNKYKNEYFNGKVVAKFTLNKVDKHHVLPTERILPFNWNVEQKLKDLCLTKEEVMAYGNGEDYQAFLWHIDNLEIFYRPKRLDDFWSCVKQVRGKKGTYQCSRLFKAPQNFCYVEVLL